MNKKQLEEYVRKNLHKINIEDEFWIDLLRQHPNFKQKIKYGVERIECRKGRLNKNSRELIIVRPDGSEDDISWLKCVRSYKKSELTIFSQALRREVVEQIVTFKNIYKHEPCRMCGVQSEHADHFPVPFKDLVKYYINDNSIDITTVEYVDDKRWGGLRAIGHEQFKQFHHQNARLRMLCSSCNLSLHK